MEMVIFGLIIISLWLAFSLWKKNVALRGSFSVFSIASQQVSGLKDSSLHYYWTGLVMAIMEHRKCSFDQAVVLLTIGNSHPDIDWDQITKVYDDITNRAENISLEFDKFVKEEAEAIIKEKSTESK